MTQISGYSSSVVFPIDSMNLYPLHRQIKVFLTDRLLIQFRSSFICCYCKSWHSHCHKSYLASIPWNHYSNSALFTCQCQSPAYTRNEPSALKGVASHGFFGPAGLSCLCTQVQRARDFHHPPEHHKWLSGCVIRCCVWMALSVKKPISRHGLWVNYQAVCPWLFILVLLLLLLIYFPSGAKRRRD